jgi:hypothetical protein
MKAWYRGILLDEGPVFARSSLDLSSGIQHGH